jgi:hypothetical protein
MVLPLFASNREANAPTVPSIVVQILTLNKTQKPRSNYFISSIPRKSAADVGNWIVPELV